MVVEGCEINMVILGVLLAHLYVGLILGILGLYLAGLWKLFKKADRNGWEAIIPFYNTWVLAEISGVAWWYALIVIFSNLRVLGSNELSAILSLASLVAIFFICYNLSKKFHKDIGTAILMLIFPFVMMPIMGFSSNYQYDKDVIVSENGPIGDNGDGNNNHHASTNGSNTNYTDKRYCQHCGKEINSDAKYCGNCGNEVK